MDPRPFLDHRAPFDALERAVVERDLARPGELTAEVVGALRYVLGFARLAIVRDQEGRDHDLRDFLRTHSWKVRDALERRLDPDEATLWPAVRVLPELVKETRILRRKLHGRFGISPEDLEREICHRKVVLVLGGGGGAGYGYAGLMTALDHHRLNPELISATSIGALIGLFRARRRHHDGAAMVQVAGELSWQKVFRAGPQPSRYGLPATLRLYLRGAIARFFQRPDGTPMRMSDLEIPMHIVATGLGVDALKHDLGWYEHFLDDAVRPGIIFRANRISKVRNVAHVFRELMSDPDAVSEVVFGKEPITMEADCVDAAGFSSAIPGLIHYDILRNDQRMRHLLDALYAEHGITRLVEGGIVDNLPVRAAFSSVMEGLLDGHRNPFLLAVDCFAPKPASLIFYPLQQIVRGNVLRNRPYASLYLPLSRTLSPLNLVPDVEGTTRAGRWAVDDLQPHLASMQATCHPFPALGEG